MYQYKKFHNEGSLARRVFILLFFTSVFLLVILGRLFQLQILEHNTYAKSANEQHFGEIFLPAKRGEILVRDTHSDELSKLATNTTLYLVYVDPYIAENKVEIAKKLAPLLFPRSEYERCIADPDKCSYDPVEEPDIADPIVRDTVWKLDDEAKITRDTDDVQFKNYAQMVDEAAARILRKISKQEVDYVPLDLDANTDVMAEVINENLPGIFADTDNFRIYGDPTLIPDEMLETVAKRLSIILDVSFEDLKFELRKRKVRYVFLGNKIEPEISRQIAALELKGIVLLPEHWRYYPESSLAAHVIGFINREETGQYGIEGYFNTELEGKKGTITAEKDPMGRQITVGNSEIINAIDGDTVILTIDRIIQKEIENILAESVEKYKADSGQVIVMDPYTGAITAMANYPTFDPNDYTSVYALRELDLEEGELVEKTIPVFKKNEKGKFVPIDDEDLFNDEIPKFVYENKFGPAVFKNKIVSEYYEPGSVFKPIVMSIALDAKEVEPHTSFMDDGPLHIDEYEIKNSDNKYRGKTTMNEVLAYSLNTGMSFVAKQLGKKLMYTYLKDFGFGEYTNIRLEGETKGMLDFYRQWSKAQLLTTSFGQGIVVTPLQIITAWSLLANGGKLMQPYIVDSVIRHGETIKTEPTIIKRVISEDTSSIITAMNIYSVQFGVASPAMIEGYKIAGKTGTSQVAGADGKYETGEGSTITSFCGYAPALEPRFVVLVKFDRPRIGENTWGATTAAHTFKRITQFLLDYYNIESEY